MPCHRYTSHQPSRLHVQHFVFPGPYLSELQTKVIRRFLKISQSQRRPLHRHRRNYHMLTNSVLNVTVVVAAFNQEKVVVGAFSVIVKSSQTFVCSSTAQPIQRRRSYKSGNDCDTRHSLTQLPTIIILVSFTLQTRGTSLALMHTQRLIHSFMFTRSGFTDLLIQ